MDPSNASRLLLGTNRVYETTNRADNWAPISTPFANGWTVNDVVDAVAAVNGDPDTIYATAGPHVFVTRDLGASWTETNPTTPNADIRYRDIRVDPNDPTIAYVVAANFDDATGGGHVWATFDAGATWNDISGNLPDQPVWTIAIQPNPGQNILHVGGEDGVYISHDGGATWNREGMGMPNVQVHQLEVNTDLGILAAATYGRGLWELQLSSASAANGSFARFEVRALSQPMSPRAAADARSSTSPGRLAPSIQEAYIVVSPAAAAVSQSTTLTGADSDSNAILARQQRSVSVNADTGWEISPADSNRLFV
jgi:photosystem II stability/assembly factor-like uncharacterized protein